MKARIILSVVGGGLVGLGASLLFAWLLFAGGSDAITPRQVDIRGVVLDETTRAPIPDARVKIASSMSRSASPAESRAEARSNERGAFQVHMTIGGMTSFVVQKPGYLYASASRDPDKPVEVLLRSVPPDSGMKLCQGGVMHPKKEAVIRLECGRGVLAEGEVDEDIRLSRGPNSTLVIDAAPGRSIQWVASQESDYGEWSGGPRNCCEA